MMIFDEVYTDLYRKNESSLTTEWKLLVHKWRKCSV